MTKQATRHARFQLTLVDKQVEGFSLGMTTSIKFEAHCAKLAIQDIEFVQDFMVTPLEVGVDIILGIHKFLPETTHLSDFLQCVQTARHYQV